MQEPIIECIPQYIRDNELGVVEKLHENPELNPETQKKLEVDYSYSREINVCWMDVVPSSKKIPEAYVEGKHVKVVATGTGSGKTESSLLPILAHLHGKC